MSCAYPLRGVLLPLKSQCLAPIWGLPVGSEGLWPSTRGSRGPCAQQSTEAWVVILGHFRQCVVGILGTRMPRLQNSEPAVGTTRPPSEVALGSQGILHEEKHRGEQKGAQGSTPESVQVGSLTCGYVVSGPLHKLLCGGWHRACARSGGACSHSRCWCGSGQRCGSLGRNHVLIKSHVGRKAQSRDRCKKKKKLWPREELSQTTCLPIMGMAPCQLGSTHLPSEPPALAPLLLRPKGEGGGVGDR